MVLMLMEGNHTLICRTKLRKKNCNFSNMMKKLTFCTILLVFLCNTGFTQFKKYDFETGKMGSPFKIIVSTADSTGLAKVVGEAFSYAEDLENQLSDYRATSDVSIVNKLAGTGHFYAIKKQFKAILIESLEAKNLSQGRLNVFAGKLVQEWRKSRKNKILPDSLMLARMSMEISGDCIEFSKDSSSIRLINSTCQIDFGSIGKGFVAQEVANFLVKSGFPHVLVDAGGKIVCTQVNENGEKWKVGLELPQSKELADKLILVSNSAIASSGNTYQTLSLNGKVYSHVLDPTTGWALEHSKSATVLSNDGARADWIATAATIVPIELLKEIIGKFKDLKILVWQKNAGKLEINFNNNLL